MGRESLAGAGATGRSGPQRAIADLLDAILPGECAKLLHSLAAFGARHHLDANR